MNQSLVRCRCGHQILAREVLRTELFERASGREEIYVKFRCRRCKSLGEAFVPESEWDWSLFQAPRDEMSEAEREERENDASISTGDLLDFYQYLERATTLDELLALENPRPRAKAEKDKEPAKSLKNAEKGGGETRPNARNRPGP